MLQRAAALLHHDASAAHDLEQAHALLLEFRARQQLMLNDSPYREVRAVVEPRNDTTLPINTLRAWTLGTLFAVLSTATNQFFSLHYPSITVLSYVAQLLAYPCGVFLAKTLPTKSFRLARLPAFSLNPGPFSQKEHVVVTVMSNVAYGGANKFAYATIVIQLLKLPMFFNEAVLADSTAWQILLVLSTQLLGFGAAGITRSILVYPAEMIWPSCLAQIALNKALHQDDGGQLLPVSGWTLSRNRFFLYAFAAMFLYFWLPNYLFTALSSFNWITWISPANVKLAVITGSLCGLGINPIPTFDWNQATVLLDPIITPFFSTANQFAGMLVAIVAIVIPIYWANWLDVAYLPPNSNILFDKHGQIYNVSKTLTADFTLDEDAYREQGIPYQSATWIVGYVAYFAVYLACLTHVALYNRRELSRAFKSILKPRRRRSTLDDADIHYRLIQAYKEVPDWWFLLLLSFSLACACSLAWNTTMPVWGLFFALGLCFVFQIPAGVILAVSNVAVELNVLADIIGGATLAGKPIANLMFKAYGALACAQSIQFSAGLKLAHYSKLPPRVTFACQVWATVVAAFVSVTVNQWQMANIRDVCTATQPEKFNCPTARSVFTSSILLGVIGPKRLFGPGQPYNSLVWGFLAGALLPLPFYLLSRRYPSSWVRYVHVPAALNGALDMSPYNLTHMWSPFCITLLINHFVKARMVGWWQKYAYMLACAFSSGLAISTIVMFFAFQLKQIDVDWWGNSVSYAGVDGGGSPEACALKHRST